MKRIAPIKSGPFRDQGADRDNQVLYGVKVLEKADNYSFNTSFAISSSFDSPSMGPS